MCGALYVFAAKREAGKQHFPGLGSKGSGERETPDNTGTQQTLSAPAKQSASSAAELFPLSLSFPHLVFTLRSAPPLPQHGSSIRGATSSSSPKTQSRILATFPFSHLPLFVAVPLLAGGLIPNDVNCTLVKAGRGRAGGEGWGKDSVSTNTSALGQKSKLVESFLLLSLSPSISPRVEVAPAREIQTLG